MKAFISYQTNDKHIAGKIKAILSRFGVTAFLAHEDISVSEEWRLRILEEIRKAEIFVSILSKDYCKSPWCIQESGIASFRRNITSIPLSIDGSALQGFLSNIQSITIDPDKITIDDLIPGIIKQDQSLGASILIKRILDSNSYRSAEINFKSIIPHLDKFSDKDIKKLLEVTATNNQVYDAGLCAGTYIPPLLKSHGHLLEKDTLAFLKERCAEYV